jgi:uncharacterized protein (DUF4415 family)
MVKFEWDENKAISNERKHGITFEDAMLVFEDPYVVSEPDRIVDGERRWPSIGLIHGALLLLVAHTSDVEEGQQSEIVALFRREKRIERSERVMGKIVRKTLADIRITPAMRRRLKKLAERPDSEIDYSDIPELTEEFWKNAIPSPFYRPVKEQVTVRLDADVIAWLRKKGAGYQTRMNALLRMAMLNEGATKHRTR